MVSTTQSLLAFMMLLGSSALAASDFTMFFPKATTFWNSKNISDIVVGPGEKHVAAIDFVDNKFDFSFQLTEDKDVPKTVFQTPIWNMSCSAVKERDADFAFQFPREAYGNISLADGKPNAAYDPCQVKITCEPAVCLVPSICAGTSQQEMGQPRREWKLSSQTAEEADSCPK
ncbi:hypothetical protein IAU59_002186 [Kwoniella sp. CBS 9459]